jgi:putative endonuclease
MRKRRVDRRAADRAGRQAEVLCALALRLKGYRVLARRARTPVGEIDILAARGRVVVAVEVKARGDLRDAAEALSPRQRARIIKAASLLAAQKGLAGHDLRFDLMLARPWRWPRHIVNAWTA